MSSIVVTLPDGSKREYDAGTTGTEVAQSIGKKLAKDAIALRINGEVRDLFTPITEDIQLEILTRQSSEGLDVIRHSTAHLLAHAVKELFPETQVTIGPVTADGFYYDFSREEKFTPKDLQKIESRMKKIAARNLEVSRKDWTKEEVIPVFEKMGEAFKVQIIKDIPDSVIGTYQQGEFIDLCRGPHVPNTSKLGKFKLLSVAGAYWRGDENNEMLQRIYGTAFATQQELDEHLHLLEEARKRDHRKLAPEMGLFQFLPIAPAMPFYLPKGTTLYNNLLTYMRDEMGKKGYQEVICPQAMNTTL